MRKAYQEIMDKVEVTEDMRQRILQNMQAPAVVRRKPGILPLRTRRALLTAAACLVLLISGFSVFGQNFFRPAPSVELAGPVFDVVECDSVGELSENVGFAVQELSALPFEPAARTYCAFWGELAQITYSGGDEMLVYRISPGTEENSGDCNEYEETVLEERNAVSVTLKGSGGRYHLAVWQKDGFSYSIHAETGLTLSQMLEMVP